MKKMKRFLFLLHRWLGVVMCLFIALWFASGIIMMYVEYPELTEAERLDTLPALAPDNINLSLEEALSSTGEAGVTGASLSSVAGRPVYFLETDHGAHAVFADSGERLDSVNAELAMATATASGFVHSFDRLSYGGLIQDDQWTVSSSLHGHRPLHKVLLGDGEGTVLYLSSRTGQIVRDTHRSERLWNWLGSTIHWIYPVQLRRHAGLWNDVIVWLSLVGLVSIASGAIIGFMRLRLKRYQSGSVSPYRGVDLWHHIMGLVCLVFVSTFMFSGLMSMSPWGLFSSEKSAAPQLARYSGDSFNMEQSPGLPLDNWPDGIKEVEWRQVGGEPYLILSRAANDRLVMLQGEAPVYRPSELLALVENSMPDMLPTSSVVSLETLREYDDYYYSRHNRYRPLPVYRVRFDDGESTWYHIDQNTGQVISRHTDGSRLGRWLYNGLHSLDFSFLIKRGLLWDVTVILLSLAGLVFSVTSVIIGWRRFAGTFLRSSRASSRSLSQPSSTN